MKKIEEIVSELSNEELKQGFLEINAWRKTGVLSEGVIRKTHKKYTEQGNTDYPVYYMENPFLYEIAKRHYNG
ncbi:MULTISPECIES: hypothetical protein [Bacillus]|uniref:hypothetical protein n=1 Tax=Bacillus TaxID=1386 RepID=UPI00273EB808|nr:hypothetical protein [Bacillus sp. MMSF_3328]